MVTTILRALTVPEIRKKLAFTALLLALYRLGSHIPVPGSTSTQSTRSRASSAAAAS
jgi:preprotein translocase subunit SecY